MRTFVYAPLALMGFAIPAVAADTLKFGPVPVWAASTQLLVTEKSADAPSFEVLLWDVQYRLSPDATTSVIHYAIRLNDTQALSNGNLIITWNPAFDEATVNSVRILRGGSVIEPLKEGQEFTLLRREQGLEQQTLDGQLTATLQTKGLQVGDIIEVTQTLTHADPTLRGHVEAMAGFGYPAKIERARFRVLVPADIRLRQRTTGGFPPAEARQVGKDRVIEWDVAPLQPLQPAEGAPLRFQTGAGFEVSDFKSWADLAAILTPSFEKATTLTPSSPIQAEIARIRAASSDPKVRAAQALALVEDKVRYVNLALGTGGLVPTGADQTWERRFGDCKAKTVLLNAILRSLDIDATPVLVSTVFGDGLDQRLPLVSAFNHVITRAVIEGRTYWLDGTRLGDVSLEALQAPDYKWGLPLVAGAELVAIAQQPLAEPSKETIITTDASAGLTKPAPTTLELVLRGDEAIMENLALAAAGAARRDEMITKQLENSLDRFVVKSVTSNYDPAKQVYRLRGVGVQTLSVNGGTYWSETPSPGYKADFRRTAKRDVDAPFAVGFPTYTRTVQTLVLPTSVADNYPLRPADVDVTLAGMAYKRTVSRKGNSVTVDTSSRSLVSEISAAEARAAEGQLRKLDNDNYRFIFPVTVEPSADEVKRLVGSTPKTATDFQTAAVQFLQAGKPGEAMAMLDKAVVLEPGNVDLRSMRASFHVGRGEMTKALVDAEAAVKAQPANPDARAIHATIMVKQGNFAAALADAQALSRVDNARAQITRAQILASIGRNSDALTAIDQALAYEPDPLTHAWRAKLLNANDRAGLQKELDAALKLDPRDSAALRTLADLAREIGRFDQQLALLDKAFLQAPDDVVLRGQRAVALEQAGKKDAAEKEFVALGEKDLSASDLNALCWSKAVAGVQLSRALDECDKSIANDDIAATRDSRALVLLRLGKLAESVKEYDIALQEGAFASALYGRSIANSRLGKSAEANDDAAKALKLEPLIARQYEGYGLARQP